MEKAAQTPNGAPHRRRRRRPAGNGSARRRSSPRVRGKPPHSRASRPRRPLRPQPPRHRAARMRPAPMAATPAAGRADRPTAEPAGTAPECPGPAPGCTPECAPEHTPCRAPAAAPQWPPGPAGAQPAAARPAQGTASAPQCPRPAQHRAGAAGSRSDLPPPAEAEIRKFRGLSRCPRRYDCAAAARGIRRSGHPRDGRTRRDGRSRRGCRMTPATAAALRCPVCGGRCCWPAQPALCQSPQL